MSDRKCIYKDCDGNLIQHGALLTCNKCGRTYIDMNHSKADAELLKPVEYSGNSEKPDRCPFCGLFPRILSNKFSCGCSHDWYFTGLLSAAIHNWNHRPIESVLQKRIDELERKVEVYEGLLDTTQMKEAELELRKAGGL